MLLTAKVENEMQNLYPEQWYENWREKSMMRFSQRPALVNKPRKSNRIAPDAEEKQLNDDFENQLALHSSANKQLWRVLSRAEKLEYNNEVQHDAEIIFGAYVNNDKKIGIYIRAMKARVRYQLIEFTHERVKGLGVRTFLKKEEINGEKTSVECYTVPYLARLILGAFIHHHIRTTPVEDTGTVPYLMEYFEGRLNGTVPTGQSFLEFLFGKFDSNGAEYTRDSLLYEPEATVRVLAIQKALAEPGTQESDKRQKTGDIANGDEIESVLRTDLAQAMRQLFDMVRPIVHKMAKKRWPDDCNVYDDALSLYYNKDMLNYESHVWETRFIAPEGGVQSPNAQITQGGELNRGTTYSSVWVRKFDINYYKEKGELRQSTFSGFLYGKLKDDLESYGKSDAPLQLKSVQDLIDKQSFLNGKRISLFIANRSDIQKNTRHAYCVVAYEGGSHPSTEILVNFKDEDSFDQLPESRAFYLEGTFKWKGGSSPKIDKASVELIKTVEEKWEEIEENGGAERAYAKRKLGVRNAHETYALEDVTSLETSGGGEDEETTDQKLALEAERVGSLGSVEDLADIVIRNQEKQERAKRTDPLFVEFYSAVSRVDEKLRISTRKKAIRGKLAYLSWCCWSEIRVDRLDWGKYRPIDVRRAGGEECRKTLNDALKRLYAVVVSGEHAELHAKTPDSPLVDYSFNGVRMREEEALKSILLTVDQGYCITEALRNAIEGLGSAKSELPFIAVREQEENGRNGYDTFCGWVRDAAKDPAVDKLYKELMRSLQDACTDFEDTWGGNSGGGMDNASGDFHKHIEIEDLKRIAELDVNKSDIEELAHYYEVEDKITSCQECQRRLAIALETKSFFGVEIWEDFSDLRRESERLIAAAVEESCETGLGGNAASPVAGHFEEAIERFSGRVRNAGAVVADWSEGLRSVVNIPQISFVPVAAGVRSVSAAVGDDVSILVKDADRDSGIVEFALAQRLNLYIKVEMSERTPTECEYTAVIMSDTDRASIIALELTPNRKGTMLITEQIELAPGRYQCIILSSDKNT